MKAYIPESLDLEQFLREHPPAYTFRIDHFKYIIGLITSIPARNKDILENCEYVPINSKLLKTVVNNYRAYLNYLLKHGIFETDNLYIEGVKSKGYRFTPQYTVPVKSVEITQHTMVKKLSQSRPDKIHMKHTKYPYLACWLNENLNIDTDSAHAYINELYKIDLKEGFAKAILKQNASLYNIYNLSEHNYYFNTDPTVGRVHTTLTTMKGLLRNFITYNGQNLVSIDIANSQPFFSSILFNSEFYNTKTSGYAASIFPITQGSQSANKGLLKLAHIKKGMVNTEVCNSVVLYIMWVKTEVLHTGKGFEPYIEDVVNGKLYEVMKDACTGKTDIDLTSKKELKKMMFMVLFTDNKFFAQTGEKWYYDKNKKKVLQQPDAIGKRIFKELYPLPYEVFNMIKSKGKAILPCLLQAIEAHVMLDVIAKRISKERPHMPLFTIHDCITCPVQDVEYVQTVMMEEMERLIGYKPTLKREYWTPENAYIELNKLKLNTPKNAKAA